MKTLWIEKNKRKSQTIIPLNNSNDTGHLPPGYIVTGKQAELSLHISGQKYIFAYVVSLMAVVS